MALEEPTACRGLEEALETVAQALNKLGPFDGILGFSQGAALAALVCALGQGGDPASLCPGLSSSYLVSARGALASWNPSCRAPCHCLPSMSLGTLTASSPLRRVCSCVAVSMEPSLLPTLVATSFQQLHPSARPTSSSWTSLQTESSTKAFAFASPFHSPHPHDLDAASVIPAFLFLPRNLPYY